MDWIKKYRFKTLEELEPYSDGEIKLIKRKLFLNE
jgi:hypothetical protein